MIRRLSRSTFSSTCEAEQPLSTRRSDPGLALLACGRTHKRSGIRRGHADATFDLPVDWLDEVVRISEEGPQMRDHDSGSTIAMLPPQPRRSSKSATRRSARTGVAPGPRRCRTGSNRAIGAHSSRQSVTHAALSRARGGVEVCSTPPLLLSRRDGLGALGSPLWCQKAAVGRGISPLKARKSCHLS